MRDFLVNLILTLGPLLVLALVLAVVMKSGLFTWLGDKVIDRRFGRGQAAMVRQAIEDEAVPPGANVAAWREEFAGVKEPSIWSAMITPALLLLLGLWWVLSSDDFASVVANMILVLASVALGGFVWVTRRRLIGDRRILRRLLDESP